MKKIFLTTISLLLILLPLSSYALSITPNDQFFDAQYYILQTHIDEAWSYTVGSDQVVVAVIDSGVDIDHPDLIDTLWTNPKEIHGNGIDDDKNGYIDDIHGWNFVDNNNDTNPQFDDYTIEGASHGTLVAGIIGAQSNNSKGIAGINWNVKIMPLRALNSKGEGEMPQAIQAIQYAAVNGADIINMSFVGSAYSKELEKVIRETYNKGVLIVAAVGNDGLQEAGKTSGGNLDLRPIYPACFDSYFENMVIGVGAVDKENKKAPFSHFGNTCIDINAPGVDIVSTQTLNPPAGSPFHAEVSGFWSGTSFATPQVVAVAALIKSLNKEYNNNQITSFLLDNADSIDAQNPSYQGKLGKGLLNAKRAILAAAPIGLTTQNQTEKIYLKRNNKALFVDERVQETIPAETILPIKMRFKNLGIVPWEYHELELTILDWDGNLSQFIPKTIPLTNEQILPSQAVPVDALLASPKKEGTYSLKLQLSYRGIPIQGGALYKKITVTPRNAPALIKNNLPLAVRKEWKSIPVTITINWKGTAPLKNNEMQLIIEGNEMYGTKRGKKEIFPNEPTIKAEGIATFSFNLNFQNSKKGVNYYTVFLKIQGNDERIKGGARVMRID